jgi:hypothetical protein
MSAYTRQLSAAARQYESECPCCDADPRAIAAEAAEARAELGLLPYPDAALEFGGITRSENAVSESLAEVRRLNRLLGPDWING